MEVSRTVVASLFGLTNRKTVLLNMLYDIWKRMVSIKRSYKELRALFPEISSIYSRNASFKSHSPNNPIYLEAQDFRLVDSGNLKV